MQLALHMGSIATWVP